MPRPNLGPRLAVNADRGGIYYITWTEGGRSRERSTGTRDRQQAEIALAEFIHGRRRGDGPRDPTEILITDVLADYAEARAEKVVASERLAYAVSALVPFWQGKTVAQISEAACSDYASFRGRSAGTIRRELGVLRAAVNAGAKARRLTHAVTVDLPQRPPSRDRWLTRSEAAALLHAALSSPHARSYLPLFIVIGLHTGARKEAILSLRWPQVDLEAKRIHWNPAGRQQTNKRRPHARISTALAGHLRRAQAMGGDLGFVVNEGGRRIGDIKKGFAGAVKRAGLAGKVSPHTLRHTRATWGMLAGADKFQLCGLLGMTIETLERVYGHHHPDYQHDAAENYRPRNVRATGVGFRSVPGESA